MSISIIPMEFFGEILSITDPIQVHTLNYVIIQKNAENFSTKALAINVVLFAL